ncbi:DCC1-like thiol-disulfide oxidoreductase family protein [Acaryochloris sp. IP29b_bin.137]|uniref:thiol-disulfide oxidoreductase DCC family protein n=1 Tax=Acaryochloris sp. IP29b_bin.137 TaxID=2969217 RepID=UPI00344C40DC
MEDYVSKPIIIFDGICNLCNDFVNFVIDRDSKQYFYFVSQQSAVAQEILQHWEISAQPETIILINRGRYYTHSTAVLKIFRHLNGFWPFLSYLSVFPAFARDWIYRWIARHRYQWFGKRNNCRLPTPDIKSRFLDEVAGDREPV